MNRLRKLVLPMIALVMVLTISFGMPTVHAEVTEGTTTDEVYFGDGFFCLHPHLKQPSTYEKVDMTAVALEHYTGHTKEEMNKIAAFIMLQTDYYNATGGENGGVVIINDDIQALIWDMLCTKNNREHLLYTTNHDDYSTEYINQAKQKRLAYLNYVNEHLNEVEDNYTMTIWESSFVDGEKKFQDILELRLVEKHGVPNMEKKVLDKNDTDNTFDSAVAWQDSADYDIGDVVPYKITATLRDMPNFKNYYLEFVDHMEHLEIVPDSIQITIDGEDVTDSFSIDQETSEDGVVTDLRVSCENILPLGAKDGSEVVMIYSAVLRDDAVIGNPGNPNEAYLIYTRTSGTADKGETAPDKVNVFTYRLTANKVDPEGKELAGAAFKLSKKLEDGSYKTVAIIGATENADGSYTQTDQDKTETEFVWNGIDDGTYKLEEVVTPTGYNTMKTIEFWVKADHDHKAENPHLYYLNSNYDGFDGFIPAEYLEVFEISIPDAEGYYGMSADEMSTDIVNQPGTVLPETGGRGTTFFYIIGSVMVFAAGVLLVTKRRLRA